MSYTQENVADLIESAVDRFMKRAEGSTNSSAVLIDLMAGWARVNVRVRSILSRYVLNEEPPPAIDVEMVRANVMILNQEGQPHHKESREIRETLAVRALGAAMTNRAPRLRVREAHHAMGSCAACGRDISIGDRFLGDRHENCLTATSCA